MDRAIVVDHLFKNFEVIEKKNGVLNTLKSFLSPQKKIIKAISNISFSIKEGELVGFIGPNGAGKTTTLKILSGLLYPSQGFIQVLGFTPNERKTDFLRQISIVFGQKNQLWWDLPAIETFELNKAIYEIPERQYKQNLEELVALLDLGKLLYTQVRRLSLGQRMRMELVASLLHNPKILFLDEPTIGLDVVGQKKVREFIENYNRKHNSTILMTSHNMDDVSNLAKRVVVIDHGKIIFDGALTELVSRFAQEKIIKIYLSKEVNYKKLENIGNVRKINLPEIVITVPRSTAAVAASEILQSFPVEDLTIEEIPLDDIIRKIFSGGRISLSKMKDSTFKF